MLQAYIFFDGKVSKIKSARFLPAYSTYAPINYCSIHKKVSYENKCPNTSMSYKIYFQRNLILVHNSHIHPQACKDFDRCMKIVFLAKPFINSYFTCIYIIYKCHKNLSLQRLIFFTVSSLITMLKLPPPAITTFHQNFWVMEEPLVGNITDLFHYCIYSGCWLVKVRGFIVYILIYKYIAFLVCQNVQYIMIWLVNLSFSLSLTHTHTSKRLYMV